MVMRTMLFEVTSKCCDTREKKSSKAYVAYDPGIAFMISIDSEKKRYKHSLNVWVDKNIGKAIWKIRNDADLDCKSIYKDFIVCKKSLKIKFVKAYESD